MRNRRKGDNRSTGAPEQSAICGTLFTYPGTFQRYYLQQRGRKSATNFRDMSDARNMVKCIARIWRMYKRQESLFRSAMGLDMSSRLRRICSNGYMMSLLFKKDVGCIYESVKSNLDDGELSSITRSVDDFGDNMVDRYELLSEIALHQQVILEEYRALLPHLDHDSDAARACSEHIDKLSSLETSLVKEVNGLPNGREKDFSDVA